ncbi:MAG: winged helix-turn-helix transcriptional regulator [Scytolyngbya sp. HA4215-MV1]|nr:winged helix-turn-helix transcriptional regulator [Scytolyngbya sp. HA4215-MV1]
MTSPSRRYGCPIEVTIEVIGGKWKGVILWWLRYDRRSFSELKQLISGITSKVLTQQLRELQADGLLDRTIYKESPPRVEYSLTPMGETLRPIVELMCEWGKQRLPAFQQSFLSLQGLPVLLLTQDTGLQQSLQTVLQSRQARVRVATDISQAMLLLHQVQPAVLLVDAELPHQMGYRLIQQIQTAGGKAENPWVAIALTPPTLTTEHRKVLRSGFQMRLSKPVEPEELIATIANLTQLLHTSQQQA